tara:strand:+ start:327 stop:1154 length:828 start_codon:yes stop_codon:yes gene_type:complete
MNIPKHIQSFIKSHSLDELPNECGGVILEKDNDLEGKRCKNISEAPRKHCLMSKGELKDKIGGANLAAVYHSHYDQNGFSWEDKTVSEKLKINLILYSFTDDEFSFYQPEGFVAPFEGRSWTWGIFSCIEIVEDYYKKAFNLKFVGHQELIFDIIPFLEHTDMMTGYFRSRKDDEEGSYFKKMVEKYKKNDIYLNFLDHNGFKEVKDLKRHDLILTKTWGEQFNKEFGIDYGIHSMIYLGDGKVLHHPYKLKSRIEKFTSKHKLSMTNILRYERN